MGQEAIKLKDWQKMNQQHQPLYYTGVECPMLCGGKMKVANSRVRGRYRIRYHQCDNCGHRPENNKLIIPIQHAPPVLGKQKPLE